MLEASPAVDSPGKERQAAEFFLVNLPFKILRSLMEYFPTSPYWESESQVKALEYWMRTPYYPPDPNQAHELKWYMKGPGDSQPHSVFRNRRSGNSPSDQDNQNQIFFGKEYQKVERNPTKRDQEAERLGLIEASHELFRRSQSVRRFSSCRPTW